MNSRALGNTGLLVSEIGLGGEIRSVGNVLERIKEGRRMGFKACIVPKSALQSLDKSENYGINIIGVSN